MPYIKDNLRKLYPFFCIYEKKTAIFFVKPRKLLTFATTKSFNDIMKVLKFGGTSVGSV